MLLFVWTRDDETGVLDDEFRDGDILQTKPDSFEQSLGNVDKTSYLILKIPDPPNITKFEEQMVQPEYRPGESSEEQNRVRHKRKFRIPWRNKFSAAEIALIEDPNSLLPDGNSTNGGTVASGVVAGLFTISDLVRK